MPQVPVTTSATLVSTAQRGLLRNGHATSNLFVDRGSGVTSGTGFLVKPDEVLAWDVAGTDDLYAVASTGTVTVYVLESTAGT